MPIYRPEDATTFEAHGSRFHSYLSGDRGAETLCAWKLEVQPRLAGVAHCPSHEEVILVLEGSVEVTLDGAARTVSAGELVHVLAGSELKIDGGPDGARAWVTTTRGLTATLPDGEQIVPPWAQ